MAASAPALQHVKIDPELNLARCLRAAMERCGKSPLAQVRDIWRLRRGAGRLTPDEYYYYGLYDDDRFSFSDKQRFLGKSTWNRIYRQCNALDWWAVAHDKLVFYAMLQGLGLPAPETRAVWSRRRRFGRAQALAEPEEIAAYLRQPLNYPFFAKPATGIRSIGVAAGLRYEVAGDLVALHGERAVAVDAFVQEIEPYAKDGYLFQELLAPHPELAAVCGPRLSTVRLVVMLEADGPAVLTALWKVPVGDNPADNFWRPGNLLTALDAECGRVGRVIQGVGPEQVELDRHPDTGQPIKGITLPDWSQLKALCLEAASAFPGLRLQAWDVAPTERGPVLVEVNIGGDFNLPQLANGAGMMTERFRAFLETCGTPRA